MKILVIEDEASLSDSISGYLKQSGYVCETAGDFSSAGEKISLYGYDCILVDLSLPGGNGLELVKAIKKTRSKAGIIIISARHSVDDKIAGLDLGADDYLAKPFNLAELNSRIRSVLRRRNFEGEHTVSFHEISVVPDSQTVTVNNKTLSLTKKEYALLLFFISNKRRVITKGSIAEHLWGDDMDLSGSFDFIYTHIKNLRKKLVDGGSEDYIKTVYGMGYKFSE